MNSTTGHLGFQSRQMSGANLPETSGSRTRKLLSSGFTLVELMVSIAILSGIILIVSSLLANAQRAVDLSQGTIAADADARAVVARLRADLAGMTTEGFLAIYTDTSNRPHLVFTAVGVYRSMIDSTIANAARIDYGVTVDTDKILWRRAFLLQSTATTADDHEQISLADYGTMTRTNINNALYNEDVAPTRKYEWPVGSTNWFNCFTNTPSITLPPNSLSEVNALWPYLARPCTDLKIHWTDGTLDANDLITWYGSDAVKKNPQWTNREAVYQDNNPAQNDAMEYDADDDNRYCALWTYKKKDNWPSALRITFTLGEGETAQTYEVIADLPQ